MEDLNEILKNWQGEKTLMTIFPHPDDETMATGGLLMTAKSLGWRTIAAVLTAGEAGRFNGRRLTEAECSGCRENCPFLKNCRLAELEKAAKILKIDKIIRGGFSDGKLKEEREKLEEWINGILDEYKPAIVVTYDHSGLSGHPDHITLSLAVKKVLEKMSDRAPLLLWATLSENLAKKIANPKIKDIVSKPTLRLSLSWKWFLKWRAARSHKSQSLGKNFPVPLGAALFLYPYEWYHKVEIEKEYPWKFVEYEII